MVVSLSALCASHTILPMTIIFLLLMLICVRGRVNPRAKYSWKGKLKIFDDHMRSWTCDLPACNIVSPPTMLLHAPTFKQYLSLSFHLDSLMTLFEIMFIFLYNAAFTLEIMIFLIPLTVMFFYKNYVYLGGLIYFSSCYSYNHI
jgi:hypothetical protein